MADVFISYKRNDEQWAARLAEELTRRGISVWWDKTIPPGKTFDQVIEEELDAAKCVVVLWSRASVGSDWVKTEASEGLRRGILVPVLIEEVRLPLEFRRVEAANLAGWQGDPTDHEFAQLIAAVGSLVEEQAPMAPPPRPAPPQPAPQPETQQPQPAPQQPQPEARPAPQQPQPSSPEPMSTKKKGCTGTAMVLGILGAGLAVSVVALIGFSALIGNNADDFDDPGATFPLPDNSGFPDKGAAQPSPSTANIYLRYPGDSYGCNLSLQVGIGDVVVTPTSNFFQVTNLTPGYSGYQVSGTITCPTLGNCTASGYDTIEVVDGATFDILWRITDNGQCSIGLYEPGATQM